MLTQIFICSLIKSSNIKFLIFKDKFPAVFLTRTSVISQIVKIICCAKKAIMYV